MPPRFVVVPLPRKESGRSCICVRGVDFASNSVNLLLYFGNVPKVLYFLSIIRASPQSKLLDKQRSIQSVSITTNIVSSKPTQARCTRYNIIAVGRWFSPDTSVFSTNKTGCHDITEILLKVALNTLTPTLVKTQISKRRNK